MPLTMARLSLASWETIARRTLLMASGTCPPAEYRRMVTEKLAAMHAHATQIAVDSPFFTFSDGVGQRAFGREYYTLLAGPRGRGSGSYDRESDLFAAIS